MNAATGWLRAGPWKPLYSPAALAFYVTLLATTLGWLTPLELHLLDLRAALTKHRVDADVVLVEIDAHSLHNLHGWPWPRRYHAELLDALRERGVKDIFYDVDFSSASNPDDDRRLAEALTRYAPGQVMLPAFIQPRSSLDQHQLLAAVPLPALRPHSSLASVNLHPDPDGMVRRIRASWKMGTETVSLAGLRMAGLSNQGGDSVQLDFSIRPDSIPRLSFADVLAGHIDHDLLKDKHVIVGATAIELGDTLTVPVYRSLPGAVVQALAYLTLREGGLANVPWPVDGLIMAVFAIFLGFAFSRTHWLNALVQTSGAALLLMACALYLFHAWHLIVACAPLIVEAAAGYAFFLVARIEQQHLRLLGQAFALRRKDTLMSSVVNHSIDAILTVEENGGIRSVNPAGRALFRAGGAQLTGRSIGDFIPDLIHADEARDRLAATLATSNSPTEHAARRADGSTLLVELALSRMDLEGEVLYTVFVRDISERVRQREVLQYQATYDALTGLANRYTLNRRLQEAIDTVAAGGPRIALLLLDLDKFKEINDALGHAVGDHVLTQVAQRFASSLDAQSLLARIGGDEFAVMVPESEDCRDAIAIAETLLATLLQPLTVRDIDLEIGASIGIAWCPDHAQDPVTLLQNADTAMYVAKRAGSGVSLYQRDYATHALVRMTISTGLRQAMTDSSLTMNYQPKLALADHRVTSAEALLRWQHPQLGNIPPDQVIDVAESTGLIWPLTEWTLQRAVSDARAWQRPGHAVRVAVNLSARLLQDINLIDRLVSCLESCGADTSLVSLEITESAIMSDPERALKNALTLSALGVHLSIDDFGTGYSSLSYLRKLPANELKIDKSFVMEMLVEENDLLIVKSTIELAHTLGLKVVAEGVESEAILSRLRELGCDFAQGYHISRPLPQQKMLQWLAETGHEIPLAKASAS